jgi:hypothetical protein
MRKKKLNDKIDLDVHQMLTALAARLRVPRATVLNRLLRATLNNAHQGKFVLMHGQWQLWDVGASIITLGTPGRKNLREDGHQQGVRFAEIEFRRAS